ncbi:MAG TPA: hypothetical protein VMG08_17475 [Allosphingosinicella sp.]|nr:hypothetical protein [Allosphingosinicella sp.]
MRHAIFSCLAAAFLLGPAPARAQSLVSEELEGNRRVCNYDGGNSLLSGSNRGRRYAVGIGENCPLTYPVTNTTRQAPPTAVLRSDRQTPEGRACVYEQWGTSWTFTLRNRSACPPAAGMATRELPPQNPLQPPAPAVPAP